MPKALISLTRTKIYDVDNDYDIEVERIDLIEEKEVLCYVPANGEYRKQVVAALKELARSIAAVSSGLYPDGSTDPPITP